MQVTHNLEINLFNQRTSPEFVCDFAIKHRVPAIVAPPQYLAPLVARRIVRSGQFKIIAAVDFPKGENFAMDKIYRSHMDLGAADGFDIMLSLNKTQIELRNEMKVLYEFIKMHNSLVEIRWCISGLTRNPDGLVGLLHNMKQFAPTYIRTDSNLESPLATVEKQKELAGLISNLVPYSLKICGNVDLEMMTVLNQERNVRRYDVTLRQAEDLVKKNEAVLKKFAEDRIKEDEEKRDASKLPRIIEDRGKVGGPIQSSTSEPKFL